MSSVIIRNEPHKKVCEVPAYGHPPTAVSDDRPVTALSLPIAALLLAASGLAALVYQLLWIKQLSLIVGVDVYAVTIGVSAFLGGVALGSYALGRLAQGTARPLRFYALVEVGSAATALAVTLALAHCAALFARLEAIVGPLAWLMPLALVALPAVLLGGTLPALMRATPGRTAPGNTGGGLYASNTAGAIAGALLTPFLLIPSFGIQGSAMAAAGINLLLAAIAWRLDWFAPAQAPPMQSAEAPRGARFVLLLYGVAGAIALGYEVLWSQTLVQFMSTRAFAFAVLIATYLFGLAAGAALSARRAERIRDPLGAFAVCIAAAGATALLGTSLLGGWLAGLQTLAENALLALGASALAGMSARFLIGSTATLLLPTLLLGAAFPLALRLIVRADTPSRDTGRVLAVNTLGGIVGAAITGLILVPALGLLHTLAVLALLAALVAIAAVAQQIRGYPLRYAVFGIGALTLLAALLTPANRLARLLAASHGGELVFYDESPGGTVAVLENPSAHFQRLYIQGVSNSGDAMPSQRYMRLQALLPLIIHPGEPHTALVIGLGTGITAGALLEYPGLERRVVAELLPAVVNAAGVFHGNYQVATDSRVEIRARDGRRELLARPDRYDLITLEPPPPSAEGVVNLYSNDFYRLAANRLNAGGILAQWLPLATQNDADTRSLVRSFLNVFPHVTLWTSEFHEMLLVGSLTPIALDAGRIRTRVADPGVSAALREVGIDSPAALLATYVMGRAGLERYAADALPVTDDAPRIEYASWVRPREIARVLPELLKLRAPPPLVNSNAAFDAEVADESARLLSFYSVMLHAYRGERDAWASELKIVMERDGSNRYYRWLLQPSHDSRENRSQ